MADARRDLRDPSMSSGSSGASGASGVPSNRAVYVISVAAELAGVHPQTLRVYERKGLVDPRRSSGGSRRYSERDIERLRHIQELIGKGLNLQGVRQVMDLEAEVKRLRGELEKARAEAQEALARTHRFYRRDLVPLRQELVWNQPTKGARGAKGANQAREASSTWH